MKTSESGDQTGDLENRYLKNANFLRVNTGKRIHTFDTYRHALVGFVRLYGYQWSDNNYTIE